MYCPFCRTSVPDGATFCPKCGADLSTEWQLSHADEDAEAGKRQASEAPRMPDTQDKHLEQRDATSQAKAEADQRVKAGRRPDARRAPVMQTTPEARQVPDPQAPPPPQAGATNDQSAPSQPPIATPRTVARQTKSSKKLLVIILVIVGLALAIGIATAVTSNSSASDPRGAVSGNSYVNDFFDVTYTIDDGFAFANRDEIDSIFGDSQDIMLNSDVDSSDEFQEQVVCDSIAYNPASGELAFFAVSLVDIPQDMSDETILELMGEGMATSINNNAYASGSTHENTTINIGGRDLPALKFNIEVKGITLEFDMALLRKDNHAMMMFFESISPNGVEGLCKNVSLDEINAQPTPAESEEAATDDATFAEYQEGTVDGNRYTNEFVGVSYTLPEGMVFDQTTDSQTTDDALPELQEAGSLSVTNKTEMNAANPMTLDSTNISCAEFPTSYAQRYSDEELASLYVEGQDTDLLCTVYEANGFSDMRVEKTTKEVAGTSMPALVSTGKIQGIDVTIVQAFVARDNRLLMVTISTLNASNVDGLLAGLTFD